MEGVSWFLLLLWITVLVSVAVMLLQCLNCWNQGAQAASIRQSHLSDEYILSNEFSIIHPLHPYSQQNSFHSGHHLSPLSCPSDSILVTRPFASSDTESIPSYENPTQEPQYLNSEQNPPDSDGEEPGYIIVIPNCEAPTPSNQNRDSMPTSSDVQHEYVNLEEENKEEEEEEEDDDEHNYLNVEPQHCRKPETSESESDSESGSDDYVNERPLSDSQLKA
ncbi:linker for activation of T-cells family member 1-like isoform X1 [Cynoglossus semilaevis]|uniref:linker for activation of T-cells family member 1-like isoform X1 n=1 Tax=Cynoglossus semilaevis TaxID=244447 RepID=UPI000D62A358|nr:linker for activation of T-cells family member 1-like isoform X1 [Cynoglossus semilaevis]XP_024920404.1 linker for activation of T-cells family member 1-like isoform X1 [Cynoglossus semilaevis]